MSAYPEQYLSRRDKDRKRHERYRIVGSWTFLIGVALCLLSAVLLNALHVPNTDPAYLWMTAPAFMATWSGLILAALGTVKTA